MATDWTFLDYTIYLSDRAQVEQLQTSISRVHAISFIPNPTLAPSLWPDSLYAGLPGSVGYLFTSPSRAAVLYNAPVAINTAPKTVPGISSPWITNLAQQQFPIDEDVITRKSGGWFGISALFGDTHYFAWRGQFAYGPPADPTTDGETVPTPAVISTRRWVDGFELPLQGEGGSGLITRAVSRNASRHADGLGFDFTESDAVKTHSHTEYRTPSDLTAWFERLYFRVTKYPTASVAFWRCNGGTSGSAGIELAINPAGKIEVYNVSAVNAQTLLLTIDNVIDLADVSVEGGGWHKLDILPKYAPSARLRLYLDGAELCDITSFPVAGLGEAQNVSTSKVGDVHAAGASAQLLGMHFDDWVCADQPVTLDGQDFLNGSKVVRVHATEFGGGNAWTGDVRALMQEPASDGLAELDSNVSAALLEVETDAEQTIDAESNSLGCAALVVGIFGTRGAGADGTLGYTIAGGAAVDASIVESTSAKWNSVLYAPADQANPAAVTPLGLRHVKGATTNAATCLHLGAAAELLGVFGPEDIRPEDTEVSTVRGNTGLHNAPYPRTPWAYRGEPPISPVAIVGGTYTGNDVGQDLTFNFPPCFIWIRRVASLGVGTFWFSSARAAHGGYRQITGPSHAVQIEVDPTFAATHAEDTQELRYRVRIVGNEAESNEDGITYQYIAFCDPGMRFALNAAVTYVRGSADQITKLVNSNMRADWLFVLREIVGGATTTDVYVKGRGHAGQSISPVDDVEQADSVGIGTGSITTRAAIQGDVSQISLALFRRDDGTGDPGIPKTLQIFSYVGDGSGNRTIDFETAAGVFPLFAIITPHDDVSYFRDPTNSGTASQKIAGATTLTNVAANGIRGGGIDQIKVGSELNANGVTYDVFLIPGGTDDNGDGWSDNGEFTPVEPAKPVDGPWDFPPVNDPSGGDPDNGGDGGDGGDGPGTGGTDPGGDDFGDQCVDASQRLINRTLNRIGITKPILDVVNENSAEATVARLEYNDAVLAVLRDFPWPFATRYATLAWVAGEDTGDVADKAEGDWTYSFRAPSNMVKARRIVDPQKGRSFDPDPIPFRVGSDATGLLVYSNIANTDDDPVTTILEYTFRATCAAMLGDALFREALMWKLGTGMCPGLARDKATTQLCEQKYRECLSIAAARASQEKQDEPDGDAPWIRGRE